MDIFDQVQRGLIEAADKEERDEVSALWRATYDAFTKGGTKAVREHLKEGALTLLKQVEANEASIRDAIEIV